MIENIDFSLVNWSRAQFALTAIYHYFFVPLTLGLGFIMAIMETLYVRTGNQEWKRITKFWMKLFGINFAIGVATGLILEFEFGTNWSNYSWFVGDIFGAPLAIEGILAFFMETTFIALMFFGWNKVSKKTHLMSTWLTAVGANISALWILVANGWMQLPQGMIFNPDTARNEMGNFWDVLLSPMAISKFIHTVNSAYVLSAIVVIGVSSWFILKKRHILFAKRSILVAAIFGIVTSIMTVVTGDLSAKVVAKHQPMKFAALESLVEGQSGAPLVAFGVLSNDKTEDGYSKFAFKIEIPKALSILANMNPNSYVPGIKDLMEGNQAQNIMPMAQKIEKGKLAAQALVNYKNAKVENNTEVLLEAKKVLDENFKYFGYSYFEGNESMLIPNIPFTFYSFRFMVGLGFWFVLFFIVVLVLLKKDTISRSKFWLTFAIINIPLAYLASQAGWIVAEMGRQPWVIQDLMPTIAAVSKLDTGAVVTTFVLFAIIFTTLLIAELKIMFTQIKKGPIK